jgi:hypothetical protein
MDAGATAAIDFFFRPVSCTAFFFFFFFGIGLLLGNS